METVNPENTHYVSLGARCNSASIISDVFHKRTNSYPFDWIDIDPGSILKFVKLPKEGLEEYLTNYINNIDLTTKRSVEDNTWFPHDFNEGYSIDEVTKKYIRRFKRFFDLLESGNPIVFLTILAFVKDGDRAIFEKIKSEITSRSKGECVFITVNLDHKDFHEGNHVNFNVQVRESWNGFDPDIVSNIQKHEFTKKIFCIK